MSESANPHASFRVSMRDIDIYGHVHNSTYLDYCEDAIVEFLRFGGLLDRFRHETSGVAYHVKNVEATFHNPVAMDDIVDALVTVARIGTTSLNFRIDLYRQRDRTHCATGTLVWVCVSLETGAAIPVPEETRQVLSPYAPSA